MPRRGLLLLVLIIVAFGAAMSQPEPLMQEAGPLPTPTPVFHPAPAPEPVFPPGLSIAGVPLGGFTREQARVILERYRLEPLTQPLPLRLDGDSLYLDPAEVGLRVDLEPALEQAQAYAQRWRRDAWAIQLSTGGLQVRQPVSVDLPISIEFDETALRDFLWHLAWDYDRRPIPFHLETLTDTADLELLEVLSPTWSQRVPPVAFFEGAPGRQFDVEAALAPLSATLKQWQRDPIPLRTVVVEPQPKRLSVLQEALRRRMTTMPGVIGVFVKDLQTGEEIGVNERVLFSGASVVKIAIMLKAYLYLESPPEGDLARDFRAMMIWSDNEASNGVLAVGESGGNLPAESLAMTQMLYDLGLNDTCMLSPYWGGSYKGPTCLEAPPEGLADLSERDPLRTDPDLFRLTTARDMGLLLAYIYEGSTGSGPVLERFPQQITVEECQAMLELLSQNADRMRIVAGVPKEARVAHKSGWISDMKADTGVIYTPGGNYLLSIFVWEEGLLSESRGNRRIADLSWLVYSFFNPF